MIVITKLSGEHFINIDIDNNILIDYNEMKIIFDKNIIIDSYYIIVKNYEYIYTNLYDIYEMKSKKDILLDNLNIIFLPYNKNDVEYIKQKSNLRDIDFPNDNLRNDKLFVLMAVNYSSLYYKKISNELKYDKDIIFNAAMTNNNNFFQYIPTEYKSDKEFMKFYINISSIYFKYASNELKNDEELINFAINSQNSLNCEIILHYLNNSYKDNEDFVKMILNKNIGCFRFISNRLQNKKEIIMLCIEKLKLSTNKFNNILQYLNDINRNDKEIILPLINMNGSHIEYISKNLELDNDIVYTAIKNDPDAHIFIHKSFFNNKDFILLCLHDNDYHDHLKYMNFLSSLNDKFKDDKDIVIGSIKKCCKNIFYCSNRLLNDKDVILTALNSHYCCYYNNKYDYIKLLSNIINKSKLKNDPDILNQLSNKLLI